MISEHLLGTHRYIIEDDLVHNIPDRTKPLDLELMKAYTALLEPVFVQYGRVFLLINGNALFNVDAQARRHLTNWSRSPQILATAIYGGNLVSRTIINLTAAAMHKLGTGRGKQANNFIFFASEQEARSWLIDQRREYLAANSDAPR